MKAIVTGGRDYVDNGSLRFVLNGLRAQAVEPFGEFDNGAHPLILIHGACGWDLAQDGPIYDAHNPAVLNKLRGADAAAHSYALEHQLEVRCYPADWSQGRAGGPARNRHMFHVERPEVVVAAPGGPGTLDMSTIAWEAGTLLLTVTPRRRPAPVPRVCQTCGRAIPLCADRCECQSGGRW